MAKVNSYVKIGRNLDYTNSSGSDIAYMDIIPLSNRVVIAGEDIKDTALGTVITEGVFDFPANTETISFGDPVFWDTGNSYVTKTATDNIPVGYATHDKADIATELNVKLESKTLQMPVQANSAAGDIAGMVSDFNNLLAKLKDSGLMANA